MSDYENHRGKAELVNKSFDELFNELINTVSVPGYFKEPYSDKDKREIFLDCFDDYIMTEKGIFHIIKDDRFDDEDFITDIDNDLNFHLKFYNGGCSFGEAFASAIMKNESISNILDDGQKTYTLEVCYGDPEYHDSIYYQFDNKNEAIKAGKALEQSKDVLSAYII